MVIRKLKEIFSALPSGASSPEAPPKKEEDAGIRIQLATCVLLLELAHSDEDFSEEERDGIVDILKEDFHLSDEYALELLELAQEERKNSVDMWQFTNVIDNNYTIAEKERVMETLWKIVYADERLDHYEDHLIHRLAKLLNLSHKQLIDAKKKVLGWE
jgi:uncharacterized tellurite resistance protein B-like protein